MTKFIAKAFITLGIGAVSLANFWFTFGIWPKSWTSFVLCVVAQILLLALSLAVDKENES